jgi:hypothetical protein
MIKRLHFTLFVIFASIAYSMGGGPNSAERARLKEIGLTDKEIKELRFTNFGDPFNDPVIKPFLDKLRGQSFLMGAYVFAIFNTGALFPDKRLTEGEVLMLLDALRRPEFNPNLPVLSFDELIQMMTRILPPPIEDYSPSSTPRTETPQGLFPRLIHHLVEWNYQRALRFLLDNFPLIDVNVGNNRDGDRGETALHRAVRQGNRDLVRILLQDRRTNPNRVDDHTQTALHAAIQGVQTQHVIIASEIYADSRLQRADTAVYTKLAEQNEALSLAMKAIFTMSPTASPDAPLTESLFTVVHHATTSKPENLDHFVVVSHAPPSSTPGDGDKKTPDLESTVVDTATPGAETNTPQTPQGSWTKNALFYAAGAVTSWFLYNAVTYNGTVSEEPKR